MGRFPRLTRRRFLALSGLSALGVWTYAWRIEPHWIELVERDLAIANLPSALAGHTLIQISDLHVGPEVDPDYLIAALQWVSTLKPALTVITGDFMTCQRAEQVDAVVQVLQHLAPAPYGCFAVLGNHDYGLSCSRPEVADQLTTRLAGLGVRVLRNECQMVAGLQLVGLDDLWGPCFYPETVLPHIDWDEPVLTLCHNPDTVDLPCLAASRGWVLCGHTHGGQCKLPFLPPPRVPVKNRRYISGEFDLGNGRWLYINRGLGHLRRLRFNVRPEITAFQLTPSGVANQADESQRPDR